MAADDYAVAGGGALKLKGGKVHKSKKKKKDKSKEGSSNLERSLSIVEGESSKDVAKREKGDKKQRDDPQERAGTPKNPDENDDEDPADYKTEAERRHEEIQRRKLMKMFEDGNARPELLKTHKERVEGLNTYLSKLSEHHDMPKIGPG